MIYSLFVTICIFFSCINNVLCNDLPLLNFAGFSWAENLAFDGIGHLFVSEAVRGELWRIELCSNGTSYCGDVYLTDGLDQVGGLSITPDGKILYAGVSFDDDSMGIISTSTTSTIGEYKIIAKTVHQPNGMAADWSTNILYITDEGLHGDNGGTLVAVNLNTLEQTIIKDQIKGADGIWHDPISNRLYVGELTTRKIMVFDTSKAIATYVNEYIGLNKAIGKLNLIDDICLYSTSADIIEETFMLASDWTGKKIELFQLNGNNVSTVEISIDIDKMKEPTSVRWGKGIGFDENSIYVTEGGGVTKHQTDRRVIQIKMNV